MKVIGHEAVGHYITMLDETGTNLSEKKKIMVPF